MKACTLLMNASTIAVCAFMAPVWSVSATAQDADTGEGNALFEEILVTATKKSGAVAAQDVPIAVTAYGERQLEALHIRDLQGLSFKMPNVSLDDIGTMRGVANFAIRGLAVNSSIPSIDPTVGVFVDGMYLGTNVGVVLDQFDLASVEVLRGPQGLLFGRNVTGGAMLLNTTKPSFETTGKVKAAYESGNNKYLAAVFSGPLVEDKIAIKLALYYNDDGGWFTNLATGNKVGKAKTYVIRPAITFRPSEAVELTVRYEHGDSEGDGPTTQNRGIFDRETFDIAYDNVGSYDNKWDQLIGELNVDVAFGDGTITNIMGWRQYDSHSTGDIDSTPSFLFHSVARTTTDQFSNELRYSGTFNDSFDVTAGLFYFTQDIIYLEQRLLFGGAVDITGGGDQDQNTKAAFASVDYDLNDNFTLNFGLRYTEENKSAIIATIRPGGCDINTGVCVYNFPAGNEAGSIKSTNWTPKLGFQWRAKEDVQVYGFYTRGFRSGGFNLRNTSPTASPGPFQPESMHSFELGVKADNEAKTVRFNGAIFYNLIDDLQREVNLPDLTGGAGVIQVIDNTADAKILGAEGELQIQLHENLTFTSSLGLLDGSYRKVLFDISGDGVVTDIDKGLELPRLANVTYGFGLLYDAPMGDWGSLSASVNFNHRNDAFYNDANTAVLDAVSMVDANITVEFMEGQMALSVFGKNLLNEVQAGGETILPFGPGHTFSPIKKGRVYGVELQFKF